MLNGIFDKYDNIIKDSKITLTDGTIYEGEFHP